MKRRLTSVVAVAAFVAGAGAFEAQAADFNVANVVVYRIGTGAAALTTNASAVFLNEYTPTCPGATLAQSVALPTTQALPNKRLTARAFQTDGMLTRSANGKFLVATGYDAAIGTAVGFSATSAAVNRVVGRIDKTTAINTTTALNDAYNSEIVYGATSTNGIDIWTVGGVGSPATSGGVRYTTLGSTTSLQLASGNLSALGVFGNQLYATNSGIVATVGTGTPTTAGQSISMLPGVDTFTGAQFVFFDLSSSVAGVDTLYVADIDPDSGGVKKYSLVGGAWTLNGKVGTGSDAYLGVTGSVGNATGVTLYATSTFGADRLVRIVDTGGYNAPFSSTTPTVCATAATNTEFHGVALAPIAATAVGWRGGRAVAGRGGVLVTWRAGRDAENLGFDVLRARQGATRRAKVTRKLIRGTALSTKAGSSGSFRFRDRRGKAGDRYFVVARATDGTKRVHGPLIARSSKRKAAR